MDANRKTDLETKWKKVATQAITDLAFRKKLVKDPIAILNEQGLTLPQGVQARVGGGNEINLILPPNPTPEMEQEAKWWKRRLDMIREFGVEENQNKPFEGIPENVCGDDV